MGIGTTRTKLLDKIVLKYTITTAGKNCYYRIILFFRLANSKNNGLYAPAFGYGRLGSFGFVDYPDICKFLAVNQISPVFDMDTKSPYASKFYEWVSFENTQSLTYKAEYIREQRFGGAMVWSLNSDDYNFSCQIEGRHEGKFPLVKSIKNALFG